MAKTTLLTFVVGIEAAERVARRLRAPLERTEGAIGAVALRQLIRERLEVDPSRMDLHLRELALRLVWQEGLLYVVEQGGLSTFNLLLLGSDGVADLRAIRLAEELLEPVAAFRPCFEMIRAAPKPMVATFCAEGGDVSRVCDWAMIEFAAALFTTMPVAV